MGLVAQIKAEILEHLESEAEEVLLSCEGCQGRWMVVGPFERRHPYACPACGKTGVINLERQAELMAGQLIEQVLPQFDDGHGHADPGPDPGCGQPGHHCTCC